MNEMNEWIRKENISILHIIQGSFGDILMGNNFSRNDYDNNRRRVASFRRSQDARLKACCTVV